MKTKVTILLATGLMIAGLTATAAPAGRLRPPPFRFTKPQKALMLTTFINTTDFVARVAVDGRFFEIHPCVTLSVYLRTDRLHTAMVTIDETGVMQGMWLGWLSVRAGDTVVIILTDMMYFPQAPDVPR